MMIGFDSMSSADINAKLENMRDVFISEIFNDDIKNIPIVAFGTLSRHKPEQHRHMRYSIGVHKSDCDTDIADEIVIDASITPDRFAVAAALLFGLITTYAKEHNIKISSRASVYSPSNKQDYEDYCGSYLNKRDFKPLADKYGLVIKKSSMYGWVPVDVSDKIKMLIKQKRWSFPTQRETYTYGENPYKQGGNKGKCVCPNCKKVSFYESKRQNLYCAECMEKIARKEFGSKWDNFVQNYGDLFKIQRVTA